MIKINYSNCNDFEDYVQCPVFRNGNFIFSISDYITSSVGNCVTPSSIGIDLLVISSLVYGTDTSVSRGKYAEDGWSRRIDIIIPVINVELWDENKKILQDIVNFLTGDSWHISFVKENFEYCVEDNIVLPDVDCISLFSGGVDSLVGAIDLLSNHKKPLLISHSRDKIASASQNYCLAKLAESKKESIINLKSYIGIPENTFELENERSERSRSFLFFSLASCVASGFNREMEIYVPENAFISLNIPLDNLRMGSFSTRTTNPYLIYLYNEFLEKIGITGKLVNPYKYKTKWEMVNECANSKLLYECLPSTMSCSSAAKTRWMKSAPKHCGYCIPCIIRKASLHNQEQADSTEYLLNFGAGKVLDTQTMAGSNVRSFQLSIQKNNNSLEKAKLLVRSSGPLPFASEEIEKYASVYLKGLKEINEILKAIKTTPFN